MAYILVVVDEEASLGAIRRALIPRGHTLMIAQCGEEALQLLRVDQYDVIVLDLIMAGASGFELLEELAGKGTTTPVVVCSAYVTSATFAHLNKITTLEIVRKPFKQEELTAAVERALGGGGQEPEGS